MSWACEDSTCSMVEGHFDILAGLLALFGGKLNCFGKRHHINVSSVRLVFSAVDSCAELILLCVQNSDSYLTDTASKYLFGFSFTLTLIYSVLVIYIVYHWLSPDKDNHDNIKLALGITTFYKISGFVVGILMASYSGYLWANFDGSVFVFVVALIDTILDLIEIAFIVIYLLWKHDNHNDEKKNTLKIQVEPAPENRF